MSIVSVDIDDIAEAQDIKLLLTTTSCCVDRKENWPCDTHTSKADDNEKLEESKEEVAVERVAFENEVIW